jgi:transposase
VSGGSDQSLADRLRAEIGGLQSAVGVPDVELVALRHLRDVEVPQLVAVIEAQAVRLAELEALQRFVDVQDPELLAVVRGQALRIAELERRLGAGSDDSGTPSSKESIEAKARGKAERRARKVQRDTDTSLRERSKDRKRGGQLGHRGRGLVRDPDPQQRRRLDPPVECRGCGSELSDAQDSGTAWSQIWDVKVVPWRTEFALPQRKCGCCGKVTTAVPVGGLVNGISFGPVLNAAAVALTSYGNVPTERAATLVAMLLGQNVSAGFVDRANARLAQVLTEAGFVEAMKAALLAEPVLTADESPVEVVRPATDETDEQAGGQQVSDEPTGPGKGTAVEKVPGTAVAKVPGTAVEKVRSGAPHVLVVRTPDERLVWLSGLHSRRHGEVTAFLRSYTGFLIVDGFRGYQTLLTCDRRVLAGIQQCCQHVFRRAKQVAKLGPGGLQSWAGKVSEVLTQAHTAVEAAKARGQDALDPVLLTGLRARYDAAVEFGITHNRLRDWDGDGNHPGYKLAAWLKTHADQVWTFTRHFGVEWTSNAAERGIKPAKRHQAVSGYWQTDKTLDRWCINQSYLISARNHGLSVAEAITLALAGTPWLPPIALPALAAA